MKNLSFAVTLLMFSMMTMLFSSCSKEKGCTDETSLNFTIDYIFGSGGTVYSVSQHYTR